MKKMVVLLVCTLLMACKNEIPASDLAKLNGYWEITRVEMPDGSEKTYGMNENYDYFQLQSGVGRRVKVMPQFDGKYLTNGLGEMVKITQKDGKTIMAYQTRYGQWNEELLSLEDSTFSVRNAENKTYYYKRATPLNLLPDGQKTVQ